MPKEEEVSKSTEAACRDKAHTPYEQNELDSGSINILGDSYEPALEAFRTFL